MKAEPTVFVVDDDDAVREALEDLLDMAELATELHPSAEKFLEAYDPARSGCLLLDVRMPGMNGLELQAKLREARVHIPVIIITGHGDVPMATRSFKMGAADFIEKPFNGKSLLNVIRKAIAQDSQRREKEAGFLSLSTREREVLDLVVDGRLNKQMARALGVHERTIEFHRKNIMRKIGVDSVPELIQKVLAISSADEHL